MNSLFGILGLSKQSVHQSRLRYRKFEEELQELIIQVDQIRSEHPGCGVAKMYMSLQPKTMGRDKFCEIFMSLGYRVVQHRNYQRTTTPGHIRYPNLITGMVIHRPYQVVQSDITYFSVEGRFYYLVFIIDVYTKEILGYNVSDHLRASSNVIALKQALLQVKELARGMIHHSDMGCQYTSDEYLSLLRANGVIVSMGGSAQENAYAERVNGIIKNEYLNYRSITSFKQLVKEVAQAVNHYNKSRKHQAFKNRFTPLEFKEKVVNLSTQRRPMAIIYAAENYKIKEASSLLDFSPKEVPQAHNCPLELNEC